MDGCDRYRVAGIGVGVGIGNPGAALFEHRGDLGSGCHYRSGVIAAADAFAQRHDVGHDAETLRIQK